MDVVISYAQKDKNIALEIYKFFQKNDINAWLDLFDRAPNESYESFLKEALSNSEALIIVYTPNSPANVNLQKEFSMARASAVPVIVFKLADVIPPDIISDFIKDSIVIEGYLSTWPEALDQLKQKAETI